MTGTVDPDGTRRRPVPRQRRAPARYRWTTYAERLQAGGRELEGLPAGRQLRLQHAGAVRRVPGRRAGDRRCTIDGLAARSEGTFESDAMQRPAADRLLDHLHEHQSEHPDYTGRRRRRLRRQQDRRDRRQPGRVGARPPFILNYDENDGLFDHVAPPTPPPGTPDEFVTWRPRRTPNGLPIGAGFRVPAHHHLAVDGGWLGGPRAVRPHVGAAVPGAGHRRARSRTSPRGGGARSAT